MLHKNLSKITLVAAAVSALLLSGCAQTFTSTKHAKSLNKERTQELVDEFEETTKPKLPEVKETNRNIAQEFNKTRAPRLRGDVNVTAQQTPFAPIVSEIARTAGFSVAFGDSVDVNRLVTVQLSDAVAEEAIRNTAFLAGYVAVFDKQQQTIFITEEASYMFRLPSAVFKALEAQYAVGGNPANSASKGGSSGSGGGGSSGGSSLKAEFNIAGSTKAPTADGVTKFLRDLAGKNTQVHVNDTGMVNVRGSAQALRRVHDFLKTFARSSMTQVEIEASVVEVALANEFALGIKWQSVLHKSTWGANAGVGPASLGNMTGGLAGAQQLSAASDNGVGVFRTTASSTSLINALSTFTDVKVVSQPRLLSMNNVPATFFDGTQLPYVGKVDKTSATGSNGGSDTFTGEVAFAIDGVSFSAVPSVINDESVQISLVPVLSAVTGFDQFLGGQLVAPRQTNKQTFMQVLAENGKTLILGGIRYTTDRKDTSIAVSTGGKSSTKEIVILLRANVIPAPEFDPIISENL